jgi:polysaccharide deacetylase family protein (PEP-CTERM system associated)
MIRHGPPVVTVDVEDWPQSTLSHDLPITGRVADNTRRVLDLLDGCGVRATFFVLGLAAEAHPGLVAEIARRGHEVASHGHAHREIFLGTREEFIADATRSRALLEDLVGRPVPGYRAPDFSVVRPTLWALDVLAEAGYRYDSSVFPVARRRYGIPDWPPEPLTVALPGGGEIVELPLGVYRALDRSWPCAGGGYMRLLPGGVFRGLVRSSMKRAPFVFYCHPYELDPGEFAALEQRVPLGLRLHQGLGRGRMEKRLRAFFGAFGGRTAADLLAEAEPRRVRLGADGSVTLA